MLVISRLKGPRNAFDLERREEEKFSKEEKEMKKKKMKEMKKRRKEILKHARPRIFRVTRNMYKSMEQWTCTEASRIHRFRAYWYETSLKVSF